MFRKRVRKDAGEILGEDLMAHPSWEFCLDEEGVAGQTECTMRPFKGKNKTLKGTNDCCVGARICFHSSDEFTGWFQLNGGNWQSPWMLDIEIFLSRIPTDLLDDPRLALSSQVIRYYPAGRARISLSLVDQRHMSDDEARNQILFACELMRVDQTKAFPATIKPLQAIEGWPESWQVPGFLRRPNGSPFNVFQ